MSDLSKSIEALTALSEGPDAATTKSDDLGKALADLSEMTDSLLKAKPIRGDKRVGDSFLPGQVEMFGDAAPEPKKKESAAKPSAKSGAAEASAKIAAVMKSYLESR